MRRAVVTGLGLVSPLGKNVSISWQRLLDGQSGLDHIRHFQTDDLKCKIAAMVPRSDRDQYDYAHLDQEIIFNPDDVAPQRERKRYDDFILYAIAAADEAMAHSGFEAATDAQKNRSGVLIGAGVGGLQTIYDASLLLDEKGPRRLSPFVIPGMLINLASGQVSIRHGLRGPNHSVVTACATGAHAIGDAARLIVKGDADVMVAGGAEAAICRLGIAGFDACRALSNGFNENPQAGSRPYDKDRDGFVMGEGAGVLVLEEFEHAKARDAQIYAEVKGYGLSGDAYHITSPAEDGDGGYRAMIAALDDAGLEPANIDYINAHGTSTPKGDEIELHAVERLFGKEVERLSMSSTKSAVGHLLGAAGAIESVFSVLALKDQIIPPTLNLDNPSVETPIDLVPHQSKTAELNIVLSNSFGFGGTNTSLIFGRPE